MTPDSIGAAKRRGKNPNLFLNWHYPHALCMRCMLLLVQAHVLHILWRQKDVESKVHVWLIHFMSRNVKRIRIILCALDVTRLQFRLMLPFEEGGRKKWKNRVPRHSGFQSKDMHVRLVGNPKLSICVSVDGCLVVKYNAPPQNLTFLTFYSTWEWVILSLH